MSWQDYKVQWFPEDVQRNIWTVTKFSVSELESRSTKFRSVFQKGRGFVPVGEYTMLRRDGCIVMSDTPDEIADHYPAIFMATGDVLIAGLGLGMVLNAIMKKTEVSSVTVFELDSDVIELTGSALRKFSPELMKKVISRNSRDCEGGLREGAVVWLFGVTDF